MQDINAIYEKVRKLYASETQKILADLMSGSISAPRQKVMFPPATGATFDSEQAETGFLKHDCAILTAYRATRTEKENEIKNQELEEDMKLQGLRYLYVDGCFREAKEAEASHEASFFVFDNGIHNARDFFAKLYMLSEKYGQDSFLFKSAGMNRTAYLISTNDDSRRADGDVKMAGQLYLNLPPVGPYTELGKGRITFIVNDHGLSTQY